MPGHCCQKNSTFSSKIKTSGTVESSVRYVGLLSINLLGF